MITYGSKTDIGRVRKTNQDSLVVDEALGLYVVADGMGGHAGGEIASRVTVETVPAVVREAQADNDTRLREVLREALQAANSNVYREARAKPTERGMGTTCVSILLRGSTAAIGNVGDSRCYLLRAGELRQLTQDHSLVQEYVRNGDMTPDEARVSRYKNVITKGIGLAPNVEPDVDLVELEEGDTLLLCSDGLTGMVRDQDIARMLASTANPQKACDRLVDTALKNGGQDNVTVVVVRYGAFTPISEPDNAPHMAPPPYIPYPESSSGGSAFRIVLVAIVMLAIGGAAGYFGHDALRPKPKPTIPVKAPIRDYGAFYYDPPVVVLNKAVRPPIVCDSEGNVYGTLASGRVYRITPKGDLSGDFPTAISAKEGPNGANWAADPQGYLYVPSKADRCINKYAPAGTRIAQIGLKLLKAPEAVALDGQGNLYVVDKGTLKLLRAHAPGDSGNGTR